MKLQAFALAVMASISFTASATNQKTHLGTPAQQKAALDWNLNHASIMDNGAAGDWAVTKPFSEVEKTGFVAITSADDFELPGLRMAIAQNMPADTTLVIYVADASEVPALQQLYGPYLNADHLKFLVVPEGGDADPIWARDSLPFPVYLSTGMGLVDSIYPQDFEPDAQFAKALTMPMVSTQQYFRGGNLLFDLSGNCFSENVNETAGLKDAVAYFKQYYGCTTVTLLNQEGGIGDIDERIKFLTGKDALTDDTVYAKLLQGKGYTVHMIPTTGSDDETYMNTLLVNGTIFVPQMGIPADADAVAAYQKLGFKAIGVYTKELAVEGAGNIHCVTMNYPVGTFTPSVRGAAFVEFKR